MCEKKEKDEGIVIRFLNTIWTDGVRLAGDTILMAITAGISTADTAASVDWDMLFFGRLHIGVCWCLAWMVLVV